MNVSFIKMNERQDSVIIFCQAPADIPYFLTLYEKFNGKKKIYLYIINVKNNFKFIKSLNLNLTSIIFIPYTHPSIKNPISLFKERKRINKINQRNFNHIKNVEVYFFSIYEDWLTSAFISALSRNNNVYYLNCYDTFASSIYVKKQISLNVFCLKIIYFFLTGINFRMSIKEKLPEFPFYKFGIKEISQSINIHLYKKYNYKLKVPQNALAALILVNPCEKEIFSESTYNKTLLTTIKLLKESGWFIIVKGHPRLGTPKNINNLIDFEIPQYIPSEFINSANSIKLCLGIVTSALIHFAKNTDIPTYSLANIFEFVLPHLKNQFKYSLSEYSNQKLQYFSDYSDFKNLIETKNLWK